MSRPKLDFIFLDVARIISLRSTCLRRKIGCVLERDGRIISCGYNGVASRMPHCIDTNICLKTQRNDENYKICNHAEQNAICQCAKNGISTRDASLYVTKNPCMSCSKMAYASGIYDVYIVADDNDPLDGIEFLRSRGIKVRQYTNNEVDYEVRRK